MGRAQLQRELAGIALLVVGAFVLGALLLPGSVQGSCTDATGPFGPVGACTRGALVGLLGLPAALLLPLAAIVHALRLLGRMQASTDRSWLVLLLGATLLLPIAVGLAVNDGTEPPALASTWAGLWGDFMSHAMRAGFGTFGAWLVVLLALSALTAVTLAWNPLRMVVGRGPDARAAAAREAGESRAARLEPAPEEMPALEARYVAEASTPAGVSAVVEEADPAKRERKGRGKAAAAAAAAPPAAPPTREERIHAEIEADEHDGAADDLPPLEKLAVAPARNAEQDKRALDAAGEKLMQALRTFRVEGELKGRTTGPTVTQFEVEPAAGVKVRQIATLADDLALAMRAPSIRIVAPIPGRGAVGVEVPNPSPEMVTLREILESREFQQARAALPVALGKDLEGKPVVADLAKMPHLLIAGATGSGKSVCVNTIITSLVYRHTPKSLRFLMVDPKMVELSVYNELPHLRHKVITDNRDAAAVLKWAVMEMNDRYQLLAANGARNVQDFNKRVREGAPLLKPRNPEVAFEDRTYTKGELPYIVVIIDEMADLMMTVQGEVETPIAMLAQKARAIGIHLILATQRPSVNVITGLIKANFPSRIAFRVASQVDSRTIIDGAGAEMLLGNGDMLFIPPGKSEPARLQGAYLSSEETERLMQWYRDAQEGTTEEGRVRAAAFDEEEDILAVVRARQAVEAAGEDGAASDDGERDKLFREAAEVCIQNQSGSTSLLQRRLNIGYGRAARIVDQLVSAGVLDERGSSKGRDVLVGLDELERIAGPKG